MFEKATPYQFRKEEVVGVKDAAGRVRALRVIHREHVPRTGQRHPSYNEYRLADPDAKPRLFAKAGLIPVIGRKTAAELSESELVPLPYNF